MKEIVKKWFQFAKNDLEAAEILFQNGERQGSAYQVCVYHCHQAIEKMFKAFLIQQGQTTPKIHDLVHLEKLVKVSLPKEFREFIRDLNPHYQSARYPDLPFVSKFIFSYKKAPAEEILNKTKRFFIWLEENLNQN